ncbi:hypothetical protein ACFLWS_06015 [Chloroflexota bacterium]
MTKPSTRETGSLLYEAFRLTKGWLKSTISEQDVAHGLRMMTWEGMASMGFNSITASGFLAAFALSL